MKEQDWVAALGHLNDCVERATTTESDRREQASAYQQIGSVQQKLNDLPAAAQAYQRAVELFDKLAADFPSVAEHRKNLADSLNSVGNLQIKSGRWPAAEAAHRRAFDLRAMLVLQFPKEPSYRTLLAGSHVNLGIVTRNRGEPEASLKWFTKAIALLELKEKDDSYPDQQRLFLRNAYWGRAQALDLLARPLDAVKDWDRAIALNPVPADGPLFRASRAVALARGGDHAKAVLEANDLAQAKDVSGDTLCSLARVCAISSSTVKDDPELREKYAARAVEHLRLAMAKGFSNVEHLKNHDDLKPLRERADYKKLLKE
jgi:tetratricopeptide (TPR) repeat protein